MPVQDQSTYRERRAEGMSMKAKAGLVLIGFLAIAAALLFIVATLIFRLYVQHSPPKKN